MRRFLLILIIASYLSFAGFSAVFGSLEDAETRAKVLERWENELLTLMEEWMIPGMAAGIVYKNETIFEGTYGVKDLATQEPVNLETLFQIGSTTKAFTSALVAMMVEEGVFSWKDRVVDLYPQFGLTDSFAQDNFLVEDLMAQHSGFYPYAGDALAMWGFDREKVLEALPYWPLQYSFRSGFSYVNNLFVVAEEILIRHTGKTYSELIEERIFEPLGMEKSTATMDDFLSERNVVTTHTYTEEGITAIDPEHPFIRWVDPVFPAGGIGSNIPEMLSWVNMHLNMGMAGGNQIISREEILFLHTPKSLVAGNSMDPVTAYCQAWVYNEFEGQKTIWHNGDTSGCHTMVLMIPSAQLGIVILSNLGGQSVPDFLARAFVQLALGKEPAVLKDLHAPHMEIFEDDVVFYPPLPLEEYTGEYYNELFEEMIVELDKEVLVGIVAGGSMALTFEHVTRDLFVIHLLPYIKYIHEVWFKVNELGEIEGFMLWEPSSPEPFWFKKVK